MEGDNTSAVSHGRTSSYSGPDGAKKLKQLPILTAKVTCQFTIDQENYEKVNFQVVVKENGKIIKQAKRTYSNFRSLDDILSTKYSRQITRGYLHKRDLPIAGNMGSIRGIGLLREQLNLYLQEILRVKAEPVVENLGNAGNINLTLKDTKDSGLQPSLSSQRNLSGNDDQIEVQSPQQELISEAADEATTNRSLGMGDPAHQIEFSTDKHNSFAKVDSP